MIIGWLSWPFFLQSIQVWEHSSNPFFTFMGAILEKCGLAEDMLDSMGQLFGPVRGGLGYSVIIVGFILGAITGTVAAQVIAMAMITMPIVIRYKYDMRYATGVLAASGTITQLVPPSLVLVVLADQLGRSVGDMYLGAWGPSLVQIALFAGYTFYLSVMHPEKVPPVPRTLHGRALIIKCMWGIIPAAVLIFLVLGTIMMGLATPTEAGAIGAIVLAVVRNTELTRRDTAIFVAGLAGCVVGGVLSALDIKSILFRLAFSVTFGATWWLCWLAWKHAEQRGMIKQAFEATMRLTSMVAFISAPHPPPARPARFHRRRRCAAETCRPTSHATPWPAFPRHPRADRAISESSMSGAISPPASIARWPARPGPRWRRRQPRRGQRICGDP